MIVRAIEAARTAARSAWTVEADRLEMARWIIKNVSPFQPKRLPHTYIDAA